MDELHATPTDASGVSPESGSAPVERASSWDEAYAQVDAAESAPATPEDTPSADPTPAPATSAPAVPSAPVPGEPPKERWSDILANTRTKVREEVLAEHQRHIEFGKAWEADPIAAARDTLRHLITDPQHGSVAASELGRLLRMVRKGADPTGEAPAAPVAKPDPEPEPDLQTGDGQLVYSAPQLRKWHDWNARQQKAAFEAEIAPLKQLHQGLQQRAVLGQMWQQTQSRVKSVLDRYAQLPAFQEHRAAITTRVKELFDQGVTDPAEALGVAYAQILHGTVVPAAGASAQAQLVAQATKQAAGKSDNPAQSTPIVPKRPRTWDEAFEQVGLTG